MKKRDLFVLLFVFSLFFVNVIPLEINLLDNITTLPLNNLTTFIYIGLNLYVLFIVIKFIKSKGLQDNLVSMYIFGFLISLFLSFYSFNVNFYGNTLLTSEIFVYFFGNGDPKSALAIIFSVIFNLVFLALSLGLYLLIVYPAYIFIKKINTEIKYYRLFKLSFYIYVISKTSNLLFSFLINVNSLELKLTKGLSFFLFTSWLANIAVIISLIAFKIILIFNLYEKEKDLNLH